MPLKAVVCWPLTQHCCEGQVLLMLMLLLPFFSLITAFLQSMFVCSWSWLGLKLCSSRLSRAAESLMKSTNTHFFLAIITSKFTQMETFPPLKKVVIKMHHLSIIGRSKLAGNVQRLPITSGLGFFFFPKAACECLALSVSFIHKHCRQLPFQGPQTIPRRPEYPKL